MTQHIQNQFTTKTIHFYRLTDANGNINITVVDETCDNGRTGGMGSDGHYHQWDSNELYNAYEWAEQLGMKLEYASKTIDVNTLKFE